MFYNKYYRPVTWKVFKKLRSSLLSFLIVRHPFERLVSAFESKLIRIANNHDREYFYNVDKYDEHWRPISNLCHICSRDFDFVIKYENFHREFESLIQYFKEFGRLPKEFKIGWINKAKNTFKYKGRDASEIYTQVSKSSNIVIGISILIAVVMKISNA
ncbi:hypothetical protein Anas_14603 [Armadillidium nasatum]|uniref:Carbohydrate sulfotransferase n=1 Tax=Armadillidium nasatum TaxID=96803 RepID=A0A5N5T0N4_9CRUS|nr:hypothetical protein Anas_14603 [Armadillidium nasatum]